MEKEQKKEMLVLMMMANQFLYSYCGFSGAVMVSPKMLSHMLTEASSDCLQYQLALLMMRSYGCDETQTWRYSGNDRFPYEFTAEHGILSGVRNYNDPTAEIASSSMSFLDHYKRTSVLREVVDRGDHSVFRT